MALFAFLWFLVPGSELFIYFSGSGDLVSGPEIREIKKLSLVSLFQRRGYLKKSADASMDYKILQNTFQKGEKASLKPMHLPTVLVAACSNNRTQNWVATVRPPCTALKTDYDPDF